MYQINEDQPVTEINKNNQPMVHNIENLSEIRSHHQLEQTHSNSFENDQINQTFNISDLFQPLAVNTNLKNLTQTHILSNKIKGGGSNDPPNTSNSFQYPLNTIQSPIQSIQSNLTQSNSLQNPLNSLQMVSPTPLLMPLIPNQVPLLQNQDLLTIYNVQNMQTEDTFHQNLQRAFLQSAMAQNIQIQQQLLAQNQALQQLLHRQQQNKEEFKESKSEQREEINDKSSKVTRNTSHVGKSLETFEIDTRTHFKEHELTSQSHFKRSSFSFDESKDIKDAKMLSLEGGLVPIPPPMPNFLIHDTDDIEKRPFMDPYGRAKTVRIGKWRWPPPKDEGNSNHHHPGGEDYMQFKMRQQVQRKITPGKENIRSDAMVTSQSSIDWDEIDFETNVSTSTTQSKSIQPGISVEKNQSKSSNKRSFDVGASRPSPGSIGKLKLSSEMRQRLEKVTFNHSVRSKNDEKPSRTVNKLEDTRKLMLERQLGGKFEQDSQIFDDFDPENDSKSGFSEIKMNVNSKIDKNEQSHQNYPIFSANSQSSFKISPPPPPIGPNSRSMSTFLPPAPQIPAPPPPIRPQHTQFNEINDLNEQFQSKPSKDTASNESYKEGLTKEKDQKGIEKHQSTANMSHGGLMRNSVSSVWDLEEKRSIEGGLNEFDQLDDEEIWRNEEDERWEKRHPTFRDHQFSRKKSSVSTLHTEKDVIGESGQNWDTTPDFLLPTPPDSPKATKPIYNATKSNILNLNQTPFLTYNRVSWVLRLRKEVFRPLETLGAPSTIHLIYCQVVLDVFGTTSCPRLNQNEKKSGKTVLVNFGIDLNNFLTSFGLNIKRNIVEMARNWPLYFARLFKVSGAAQLSEVEILAVSHWGLHLVKKQANSLQVMKSYPLNEVQNCSSPRPTTLTLEFNSSVKSNNINGNKITLWTVRAQQINEMVNKFCGEYKKLQSKFSPPIKTQPSPPSERLESITILAEDSLVQETKVGSKKRDVTPPPPSTGRFSLLQFAEKHFRNCSDQDLKGDHNQLKHKENLLKSPQKVTKKYQMDLVRYQATPLENSLLKFEDPELNTLAVECFECILRYCGDLPLTQDLSEVKCVYTVLMHCHKHSDLRDEIYCQLIKQTTLTSFPNQSQVNNESFQRAWRLLSILAAYFTCSESLLPYLVDHLTSFTSDKHRNFHGTASVCLLNLRKTQKFGGRKNVPSIEEVTAVSAGRNFRRQIYRLPGGGERVVNTKNSTVVQDVIDELCELIGIGYEIQHNDLKSDQKGFTNYRSEMRNIRNEKEEFSLYCIVQGDSFTMPLSFDEYILDVTTELQKTNQVFYLIFCRSIWFYPLKSNPNPLYIEILFNQLAPDYLEGLLLILPTQQNQSQHLSHQNYMLNPNVVNDVAFIAALLHRSADLKSAPNLKEVKFLLPKPILSLKEPKPSQWLSLVQSSWLKISSFSPITSKLTFLNVLKSWNLFGSSFFAVKLMQNTSNSLDSLNRDYILALNRNGIHFLDLITHETVKSWPFSEVISTRKVKSEEGVLFLDLKCGNLMQQRVTRLQTEQAHEISRLIRGYINLEQVENGKV
ncbi:uncharacterized protein [Onthophagus taurus]|uniref:uncharacterized protein n=1 Tax=Onthophagus taurus TaxID=166361 RepID=UPI000C2010CD|nr:uncharacterized protein LOC111429383 [Onthophagus taurus]